MASKRRSFISLIFIINCITKCSLNRIIIIKFKFKFNLMFLGNQVQVDPYLEDSMCDICHTTSGPFFCREESCFKYYCHSCWLWHHSVEGYRQHRLDKHYT